MYRVVFQTKKREYTPALVHFPLQLILTTNANITYSTTSTLKPIYSIPSDDLILEGRLVQVI